RHRGLEIDDQLEPGRLLDRQIGRLGPLEDPTGVNADLAIGSRDARPLADQAAELDELTPLVYRRNGIARRQRHELLAPAGEERISADEERPDLQLDEGREGGVDLAFGACLEDMELPPLDARRLLNVSHRPLGT